MNFDFSEQTILVTGASSGIGRAIALLFAAAGGRVAVHYNRNQAGAQETFQQLSGAGHLTVQANIRDAGAVEQMVAEVQSQTSRIHVLVNNVGIFPDHPIAEVDYDHWQEAWERTLQTNLIGPANVTFCVARHMMAHGGGRIVNVSSRGAFRGEPTAPAYGASKAGLNAMGQSLAKALAPHNIFVHTVAPGFVETERVASTLDGPRGDEIRHQSPLGRVARPEEVARTVLFLASEESIFLTGCIVDINGASYLRT
jgi:NAD(P)-dependent dehydrogenase (short-subunit alcohol dehydrogenase family)